MQSAELRARAGVDDLNKAAILDHASRLKALIDEQAQLLIELERQIARTGVVLRVSQPPADGKVDIRWWLMKGDAVYRTPILVQWVLTRVRRYKVKVPKRMNVRTDGNFAVNAASTRVLVAHARDLIRARAQTLRRMRTLGMLLGRLNPQLSRSLALSNDLVNMEHASIVRRLEDAGYVVEDQFRPDGEWGEAF